MKKYIVGSFAVLMIVVASAFTLVTKKTPHNTNNTVWYYNAAGTGQSDFQNGVNWATTNSGSCADDGGRPCQISAAATTQAALTTYLSGFNKAQILGMSTGRKP